MDKEQFVASVRARLGAPYRHQGRNEHGYDCIGLAVAALEDQGITVDAPTNYKRAAVGDSLVKGIEASGFVRSVPLTSELKPADVLVFRIREEPQHVGIYVGDGKFIHATWTGQKIREGHLGNYWRARLVKLYRWIDG